MSIFQSPSGKPGQKPGPGTGKPSRLDRVEIVDADGPGRRAGKQHTGSTSPANQISGQIRRFSIILVILAIITFAMIKGLLMHWEKMDRRVMGRGEKKGSSSQTDRKARAKDIPAPKDLSGEITSTVDTEPLNKAVFLARRATLLESEGNLELAIERYREALQVNPNMTEAHKKLGKLYLATGQFDEAVRSLTRVIADDPADVEALNDLGAAHLSGGMAQEALLSYRAALAVDPEYATTYFNAAITLIQLGRLPDAKEMLSIFTTQNPDSARGYREMGYIHALEAEYERSLESLASAIALEPTWHQPYMDSAVIYAKLNRRQEAIAMLKNALERTSALAVYQLYQNKVFRDIQISEEGKTLEKLIAKQGKDEMIARQIETVYQPEEQTEAPAEEEEQEPLFEGVRPVPALNGDGPGSQRLIDMKISGQQSLPE